MTGLRSVPSLRSDAIRSSSAAPIMGLWQQGTSLLGLTRSTIAPSAERYSLFMVCFVFALYERKNETQIIGTYHAAAGEKAFMCGTAYALSLKNARKMPPHT